VARKPAPDTRDRILAVAARLFNEHGVRAVGMQQIVDETGLGKSLFYREFTSKDGLVAAWLRRGREQWAQAADMAVEPFGDDPEQQLLALISFVRESIRRDDFYGCIFYTTLSEFREIGHPGRQEAMAHLNGLRERLERLAKAAEISDPRGLADTLMLIVGGVFVNGVAFGGAEGPGDHAVAAAEAIIRQAAGKPATLAG
jgi:AcrR family transcriptional regulator